MRDAGFERQLGVVDEAVRDRVTRLLDENAGLRASLSDLQLRLAELERIADMDTLTPLPNRRAFLREADRAISRVARYGDPAAIVFIDVDGLKAINDRYGHSAGDAALNHVAGLLARAVRASDFVARIGGDEFAMLLDHVDEAAAAAKVAALADAASAQPMLLKGKAVTVYMSFGVARIAADDTVDALIARADAQMYRAKPAQRSAR